MSRIRWDDDDDGNTVSFAEYRKTHNHKKRGPAPMLRGPVEGPDLPGKGGVVKSSSTRVRFGDDMPPEPNTGVLRKQNAIIRSWRQAGELTHGRIEITDEIRDFVSLLSISGASHEQIAACLTISVPTLRAHFSYELDCAPTLQNAAITEVTIAMAKKNPIINIFWQKARGGWKDVPEQTNLPGNQAGVNVMVHIGGVDAGL